MNLSGVLGSNDLSSDEESADGNDEPLLPTLRIINPALDFIDAVNKVKPFAKHGTNPKTTLW